MHANLWSHTNNGTISRALTLQHLVLTILQIYMARIICVLVVLLHVARIASTGSDYAARQNEFRRLHQADDVKRNNDMEKVAQASISSMLYSYWKSHFIDAKLFPTASPPFKCMLYVQYGYERRMT